MGKTITFQRHLIIFGIPLLTIGFIIFMAKSPMFQHHWNHLAIGITFDLLLTIPLVYFLLIRKTYIPKTTVVPLVILGMVVCSFIIPSENQYYLNLFKTWIFPIIELAIIAFVFYNIRKAIKQYKQKKTASFDFFTTLKSTCYDILPKQVVMPVVTEIAVFYYGFLYWKKRPLRDNEFTYHKDSGTMALLIAIICIVAIETFVLHILLAKWSHIATWVLTCLSIYSGLQIFGFLKSMTKRPIAIENGKLYLRYGIMNESIIDLEAIDSIELSSKDMEKDNETRKLSFLGDLESHNTIIKLKTEQVLTGLYGMKRTFKVLALYVDNNTEFKNRIDHAL